MYICVYKYMCIYTHTLLLLIFKAACFLKSYNNKMYFLCTLNVQMSLESHCNIRCDILIISRTVRNPPGGGGPRIIIS